MRLKPIGWIRFGDCIKCVSHYVGDEYPRITRNGKMKRISRLILEKRYGTGVIKNRVARHTCDNRWCINPDHIILGTVSDNNRDASIRGRTARGNQHYCAKLTAKDVKWMRQSNLSYAELGRLFGVRSTTAKRAKLGMTWKHV